MTDFSDVVTGLFGLGTEAFLLNDAIQRTEQTGQQALETAQASAADITSGAEFQPFTVTSGQGVVDTLASDGRFSGLDLTLALTLSS